MFETLAERLIEASNDFTYDGQIRSLWVTLIKNEQKAVGITFDLENDDSVSNTRVVDTDLVYENGDVVKIDAQLYSAGGDWEDPVGYFRCQTIDSVKGLFIVIPTHNTNKNLIKTKKGYQPTDGNSNVSKNVTKIVDIETSMWDSLTIILNKRLKPLLEYDVDYKSARIYTSLP